MPRWAPGTTHLRTALTPRGAAALGAIAALAVATLILGAFSLGRASAPKEQMQDLPDQSTSAAAPRSADSKALSAAQMACRAEHRPSEIPNVTDEDIQTAEFDANRNAAVAASLDPEWIPLRNGLVKLHGVSAATGRTAADALAEWQAVFSVVRAECLKTGVGDINTAGALNPSASPN